MRLDSCIRLFALAAALLLSAGCPAEKPDCMGSATVCSGTCTDLRTDNANCGACGTVCDSGLICSGGTCALTCQTALVECASTCVDPLTSPDFCGATLGCGVGGVGTAGAACGPGQICSGGTCALTCQSTLVECASTCVDPLTSPDFCGATLGCGVAGVGTAGVACGPGQTCSGGTCTLTCPPDLVECGSTCVDPLTSPDFCGATLGCGVGGVGTAGVACGPGQTCSGGTCALTCQSTLVECASTCVDPLTSPDFCGATLGCGVGGVGTAGVACGSGQICSGGTCALTCQSTLVECASTCVDPLTSPDFCGATLGCGVGGVGTAGVACGPGQICKAGTCALTCQPELVECAGKCIDPTTDAGHCGATLGCGVAGVGLAGAVCGGFTSCFKGYCMPIGPSLDPTTIPQFVAPLVIPPAMPKSTLPAGAPGPVPDSYYEIAAAQFLQQVLPPGYPPTTVWGYGKVGDPSTFNFPAFTIEAMTNERVRVKWVNSLVNGAGGYLPHLFPVDDTIHWANPPNSMVMTGLPYTGPVPIVAHVHGAHVADHSDGNPDDWFLPAAVDLPPTYLKRGAFTPVVPRLPSGDGYALYEYTNDQPATTLWYHDHALGITRLNVEAGLAGFWLLRSPVEDALGLPGPAPARGDAAGTPYYEIPLAIQDRSFKVDGSFDYPDSRALFDGFAGPYMPTPGAMISPIWNPEFFGNAIVVNGRTWPFLEVEARLYRFRLLNGCNSRFLKLALSAAGIPFQQIGSDSGLLPAVTPTAELLLGPGERADVLVDFSGVTPGTTLTLLNLGPDEPYKGPALPLPAANPATTGRVMQFRVVADTGRGVAGAVPASLPAIVPLTTTLPERELTLNEIMDMAAGVPAAAKLGTAADGALNYVAAATETPTVGNTEIWRVVNLTADAHPIHLHLVSFQVLSRTPIDVAAYDLEQAAHLADPAGVPPPDVMGFVLGPAVGPLPNEAGWKDTVVANPGEVTRLIATFDLAGKYVWHCHILEHEDNEMMRPLVVIP